MCEMTSACLWGVRWRGNKTDHMQVSRCQKDIAFKGRAVKRTKRDISNLALATLTCAAGQPTHTLQLQRGVVPKEYLRGILYRSTSRIHKLLQKHLSKDPIRLIIEDGTKDNRHPVMTGLDEDRLVLAVVYCADGAAFGNTGGRGLGCVFCGFGGEGVVFGESLLERGGHGIALEEGDAANEVVASIYCSWGH